MTHTDPTAAGLLAGVLARPECDTARVVYAERLDDLAGTVPCCGHGCKSGQVYAMRQCRDGIMRNAWGDCPTCRGTGTVSDGLAERAELIRVQVAKTKEWECNPRRTLYCECGYCKSKRREHDLLTPERCREWFGIACPECDGTGRDRGDVYDRGMVGVCRACTGTGLAPVEVRRGFAETVRCRMGDVLEHKRFVRRREPSPINFLREPEGGPVPPPPPLEEYYEWVLTPWAAGVLKAHPVTRWEIVDVPIVFIDDWQVSFKSSDLPEPVFAELREDQRAKGFGNVFAPQAEARDALARAVGRVARRLAGLPEVTP